MSFSLLPKLILEQLTDITPALLADSGVRALLMDFDNTIVPYTTNQPSRELLDWLSGMRDADIFLCVVSNSKKTRVVRFCETYALPCVTHSRKPFQKGIRAALARHDLRPEETALVGDQIFTDVLGANCGGLRSSLIRPLHLHNIWLRLRHLLEKPMIFLARGRRVVKKI